MAIKFSQFNLRTDHTSGMYLVGYDGNQNIHITVDNLFDDFINGTENTIAMFGTGGAVLADSILSQDAGATILTVAGQLNVDAAATFDTSVTVTGDSTLNGNVTLGNASADLITQTGTLYLNGPVKDTTDTLGAVDQILVSDATGELTFQDLLDTHVGSAEVVKVPVKNVQGSALVKGDPVYISGSVGASGRLQVQLADASNTLKMPSVGLLFQDLANNGEGYVVITGKLRNIGNSPIDGVTPTEGDVVYVKPSGTSGAALTTTKPVYGNFIQNIGKVGRVSTNSDGTFVVSSILRSNDIPNLTPGRLWVGSTGNTIESQTLFVDEANGRLGIGTSSPATKLDVNGDLTSRGDIIIDAAAGDPFLKLKTPAQEYVLRIDRSDNEKFQIRDITNSATRLTLDTSGNIGSGTTSPFAKLHIKDEVNNPGILVESSQATGANFQNSYINLRAQETSTNTIASGNILIHGANTLNAAGPKTLQIRNLSFGGADVLITTYDNTNTALNPARFKSSGQVQFEEYGSGTFTGTATKTLAVDASGNVIETAGVSVDGSGTANYVTKWFDTDTITDSVIYDDGTNVGIGTALPNKKLHVATTGSVDVAKFETTGNASILVERTASLQPGASKLTVANNGQLKIASDNLIKFATSGHSGGTERMRINNDGKVGIGTTSPSEKLTIDSGSNSTATYIRIDSQGTDRLKLGYSFTAAPSATTAAQIYADSSGNLDLSSRGNIASNIQFYTSAGTSPVERMRITSSGNVGIGTTAPGYKLDVQATGTVDLANFETSGTAGIRIANSSQSFATRITSSNTATGLRSDGNIKFFTDGAAAGTERMIIENSTGDVGIGIGTPDTRLHVKDDAANNVAKFETVGLEKTQISFKTDAATNNLAYLMFSTPADGKRRIALGQSNNPASKDVLKIERQILPNYTSANMDFGGTGVSSTSKFGLRYDYDTDQDSNFNGFYVDANLTGTTALTGDRTVSGINVDMDSSAAGGNTAQELTLKGINVDVGNNNGSDAHHIYGVYARANSTRNGAGDNISDITGGYFQAINSAKTGQVSNMYGSYSYALLEDATHTISDVYGSFAKTLVSNGFDGTISTKAVGSRIVNHLDDTNDNVVPLLIGADIENIIDSNVATSEGVRVVKDINNNLTITDSYLFKGKVEKPASSTITNNWGLYLEDVDKNYLEGTLRLPTYGQGNVTGTATKNLAVDSNGNVIETDGSIIDGSGTANYVSKWSDANTLADSQIFDNGTNVGIGTTSPNTALEVDGAISTTTSDYVQGSTGSRLLLETSGSGNTHSYIQAQNSGGTTSNEDLAIQLYGGSVGIGTSSPTSKLEVNGNLVFTSENNSITFGGVTSSPSLQITNSSARSTIATVGGSGVLKLDSYPGIEITTAGYDNIIDNSGRWGIGTTSPASKLDVNGGIRMANDSSTASASNVGTLKYYTSGNNSYVDMCMQTGASTYAWVNIVQNNW